MAPLEILKFPDHRLRNIAKPIKNVDGYIVELADQMLETMHEAPGIGLAASQVNVHKRLLVVDISEKRDQPLVLINPEIKESEGSIHKVAAKILGAESCNGWTYWYYKSGNSLKPIDELRQRLRPSN